LHHTNVTGVQKSTSVKIQDGGYPKSAGYASSLFPFGYTTGRQAHSQLTMLRAIAFQGG